MPDTFDVVAVDISTNKVRFFGTGKSYDNADAIVNMAIMQRGLETEFYAVVPHKLYADGEDWHGGSV